MVLTDHGSGAMEDPHEHALVLKALSEGLRFSTSVMWESDTVRNRVASDPELQGLTPEWIRKEVLQFVKQGGRVDQRQEVREHYRDRHRFYYRVVMPVADLPLPLFVEMRLTNSAEDDLMVTLVNAHLQRS